MQAAYDLVRGLGVPDSRIFAEAFGPASLVRTGSSAGESGAKPEEEAEVAVLKFSKTMLEQRWNRGDPTILEVAEQHGLEPAFGCR